MTTSRNATSRSPYPNLPLALDVTTDQNINEGDMVWWDSVNGTLKPVTVNTQVAVGAGTGGFAGVATGSNLSGGATGTPPVYPAPAGGTSEQRSGIVVCKAGSVFLFGTPGEFYANYTAVTVGSDAQHVTLVGATNSNRVGWVVTEPPVVAQAAAGGTPLLETIPGTGLVEVLLEAKFPNIGIY